MPNGRFAPSPTGDLHLGNLRTALVAWLFARASGGRFVVRMEDLDRVASNREVAARQLDDLALLGLDWDGPVRFQSDRFARYDAAIDRLSAAGLTYPCYCTRREIRDAISAPQGTAASEGTYPGTCRDLSEAERAERERAGRPAALRLRSAHQTVAVIDRLHGVYRSRVDDVVLRRNDGVPAYNLAVVVDDAAMGVEQVVRADDLLPVSPSQSHLGHLLGLDGVTYAHVPLVLGADGDRLAKRHGSVTLRDLAADGITAGQVTSRLAASLGLARPGESVTTAALVDRFDPDALPTTSWRVTPWPEAPWPA